jgi:site-specific recombinase XerD
MNEKLNEFLVYLKVERNCSPKTLSNYQTDIEQFISEMNIKEAQQITKHKIREFLGLLTDKGIEPSTRNRKLTAIRSFCKYLIMEGYMQVNPTIDISYAKMDKRLPKVITVEQTINILDSAESLRDKAALEILYGAGLRVGELVNITIQDIDISNGRLRVFGKGSKERIVPLTKTSVDAIQEYLCNRKEESKYLFPSPVDYSKPITTRAMYNVVRKYGYANGVHMSPHKFRHSIATHLLARNMDIRKIQELLGHANINTTTVYAQVAIDQMANQFHLAHPRG